MKKKNPGDFTAKQQQKDAAAKERAKRRKAKRKEHVVRHLRRATAVIKGLKSQISMLESELESLKGATNEATASER